MKEKIGAFAVEFGCIIEISDTTKHSVEETALQVLNELSNKVGQVFIIQIT